MSDGHVFLSLRLADCHDLTRCVATCTCSGTGIVQTFQREPECKIGVCGRFHGRLGPAHRLEIDDGGRTFVSE